jgi:hypothetical protein
MNTTSLRPLIKAVKGMVAVTFLGGCRLGPGYGEPYTPPDAGDSGAQDAGPHHPGDAGSTVDAGAGEAG